MAKQVLFIKGAGEGVHDHWDNQLVASLERELGENYAVRYPRMPGEDDPSYTVWKAALASELDLLEDRAVLVGHSFGGTVLIHAFAEQHKPRFGGLFVLAAPFFGEGGWSSSGMGDCREVPGRISAGTPLYLYHSAEDAEVPAAHVHLYAKAFPRAVVRMLEHRDHQFNNDLSDVAADIRLLS